jgi:glycosyltransferase involved in cell wall biosynthesis
MELSLVIPVFNEADNVRELTESIRAALGSFTYEVIWVDDGSTDKTADEVRAHSGPETKLILLTRNFGQTAAMAAGIDAAEGEYIVTLDGDQQNNPADIPALLNRLKAGDWDVVAGNRKNRKDNWLRKIPSRIANGLIRGLSGVIVSDYGCTLKVFRRPYAKNLDLHGELHRFIPILAALQGARITEAEVSHSPRRFGKSKYGLGRTLNVLSDLLLLFFLQKYFRRPIHLFGPLGLITLLTGSLVCLYLLAVKLGGEDIWGRPLLILGVSLVLAGIQFLTFGILAELMMRLYYSSGRKTYTIKQVFVGSPRT